MRPLLLIPVILLVTLFVYSFVLAAENAMPLTKQNVVASAIKMKQAIEQIKTGDQEKVKNNFDFAKQLISRMVVRPITETAPGYDYDATVYQIARIVGTDREPADKEYRLAIRFLFKSIYSSSNHLRSYGVITDPTKNALDDAVARFN